MTTGAVVTEGAVTVMRVVGIELKVVVVLMIVTADPCLRHVENLGSHQQSGEEHFCDVSEVLSAAQGPIFTDRYDALVVSIAEI
jgi:hypothetical protein